MFTPQSTRGFEYECACGLAAVVTFAERTPPTWCQQGEPEADLVSDNIQHLSALIWCNLMENQAYQCQIL